MVTDAALLMDRGDLQCGIYPWWPGQLPGDSSIDYGFPNDGYGSSTYVRLSELYNYDPGYYDSGDYRRPDGLRSKQLSRSIAGLLPIPLFTKLKAYYIRMRQRSIAITIRSLPLQQERLAREGYYHGG